jgi:hypothetical protein
MKAYHGLRLGLGLACVLTAAAALADGWSLPNLNPFKKEEREVSPYVPATRDWSAAAAEEPPTSGFKLPKLKLPKIGGEKKPSNEPGAMQRVTQGTKSFLSKTADVLTPWDKNDKPLPSARATGVRRTYSGSPNTARGEKKSSLFSSWFSDEEEPQPPRTVNGFLGQPRPKF